MMVPPLPRLHKDRRNVSDMYVSPWMTVQIKDEEPNRWKEVNISTHQIFRNDEKPAKYIYIIGEAGSGKSTLCKMLVHFWCIAQSYQECRVDERDIVEEMKKFNFLFYVSLQHFSDCSSIEEMLKKSYSDTALGNILQNDSGKCLIVLDGLDEWSPERKHSSQFFTIGLPGRELDADYTIITTTRQWKFDALPISDSEVDKKIKLKGIDLYEIGNLTKKTIEILNDIYQKSKTAAECVTDLERREVSDISHSPLVLQQLVCLWFDDKLRDNSKCDIYKSMLNYFFEWKVLWTSEGQKQLYGIKAPSRNTHVTQYLSYLAYETLFDQNKETRLAFSSSTLTQLSIPNDVIKDCLDSGILKQERNVSLSESIQLSISFFHKSMQEYLAAVYIANEFKEMLKSQKDKLDLTNVCKKCVEKYFGSCKTVVDILEQSDVLNILCRLEPQLLTNVSEHIYNVTLVDKTIIEERNKVPVPDFKDFFLWIYSIQRCIFKCIKEVMSIEKDVHLPVYIADLSIGPANDLKRYVNNIIAKNVLSVEVDAFEFLTGETLDEETVRQFRNFVQLKAVKIRSHHLSDKRIDSEVATILETNVRTLETVSLLDVDNSILTRLLPTLSKMRQLTSLQMYNNLVKFWPHDVILSLGEFLTQNTSLQHISLLCYCEKHDKHTLHLSNHKQLRHVNLFHSSFYKLSCNTDNLETCKHNITRKLCNSLYNACKLKHLHLCYNKYITENRTVSLSENLIRLLPSLVNLTTLELWDFVFTNNVIARPCAMNNLKTIKYCRVKMSMTTWCKFIDSLPALPNEVTVEASQMYITDGTLLKYSMLDEKQVEDAKQYVREKTHLFIVTEDVSVRFQFTCKKV